MRYPGFLQANGTIGFVAPSFGAAVEPYRSAFLNAVRTFEKMGYKCRTGPNVFKNEGIGISSTPENCGKELTDMYLSKENDVLISVGGGELMCEDLPFVDFEAVKNGAPKWYMGYSDNTNFTFLLTTLCDVASIYAPCAGDFGMEPWHKSVWDAYHVLTGETRAVESYDFWEKEKLKSPEEPLLPYNLTEKTEMKFFNWDGQPLSGRLLGGCLDCLVNLCGTRFDKVGEFNQKYANDGILWFLEACDLNVFSIRRAVWELKEAGWFENAKGFLIGRPLFMGQELFGLDQYEAVLGIVRDLHVPVLMDLDIGHLSPKMPVITGARATVRLKQDQKLRVEYDFS